MFLKYFLYFISTLAVLAAGLLVYLIWFQPAFYFPKPTGQYAVGIKTYHWIDTKRKETLADDQAHPNRELMVNIWYPAQGPLAEKPTTPYAPDLVGYLKKNQKIAWFSLGLSRPIYSYAQQEASIDSDKPSYPVIIFSHGFELTYGSNTAQCEELASHGYIVIGISHSYDSRIVQFPDGRIIDGSKSIEKRLKTKAAMLPFKKMDQEIEIWISDVRFVLDKFEQISDDRKSPFYQRIDKEKIGMFGHSFGGATAIQICRREPRVKAGVDLDGGLYGYDITKNFDKPFMFILSDNIKIFERSWTPNDWKTFGINSLDEEKLLKLRVCIAIEQLAKSMEQDIYTFIVKGAGHLAFCDYVLLKQASSPACFLRFLGKPAGELYSGPINGFRSTEIVNAYLINFFDKYLKGKPSELLDGKNMKYPEVEEKNWDK